MFFVVLLPYSGSGLETHYMEYNVSTVTAKQFLKSIHNTHYFKEPWKLVFKNKHRKCFQYFTLECFSNYHYFGSSLFSLYLYIQAINRGSRKANRFSQEHTTVRTQITRFTDSHSKAQSMTITICIVFFLFKKKINI